MTIFEHFNLTGNPFIESIPLDRIHLDGRFKSALASLTSLPELGDMALLTGRTGTGKTTLLKILMDNWKAHYDVHYLHLGNLHGSGLLRAILDTVGEQPRMGKDRMFTQLFTHLEKKQRPLCLLVDEVQLMDIPSMTDLRLLSGDIELAGRLKLLLSGQPQMKKTLQAESLTDLRERMTMEIHLNRMSQSETHAYIERRLNGVGCKVEIFEEEAIKLIYHHTEGIPRRINRISLGAIMIAYQRKIVKIDESIIRDACVAEQT